MQANKTVRKQLGCGKKKDKRRNSRARSISQKIKSKTTRSRKDIFEKKMRINRSSHFWYEAFTNFAVQICNKVSVLETTMSSHTQEELRSTSLAESLIKFEFETNHNLCFGMPDTHLNLKLHFLKRKVV